MSKKMLKRSLALGALMAFVITGSAMAADPINKVKVDGGVESFTDVNIDSDQDTGLYALNGAKVTLNGDSSIKVERDKWNTGIYVLGKTGNTVVNVGGNKLQVDATGKNEYARGIEVVSGAKINLDANEIYVNAKGAEGANNIGLYSYGNGSNITVSSKSLNVDVYGSKAVGLYAGNNTTSDDYPDDNASIIISENTTTRINVYDNEAEKKTAGAGIEAFSMGRIDIKGDLYVNAKEAIVSRGGASVNINNEGKNKVVQLTGDIDFNYHSFTSGTKIDAAVNLNLTNADSFFTGKIYKSGDVTIPDGKDKVTGMNISLSNGAKWNLTGESIVANANFGKDSVLNIKGADFDASKNTVYALNASEGAPSLKVEQGAKLEIEGIAEDVVYNVAKGFNVAKTVGENWTIGNNLLTGEWSVNAEDGLQVKTVAKEAEQIAEDLGVSKTTGEFLGNLADGAREAIAAGVKENNSSAEGKLVGLANAAANSHNDVVIAKAAAQAVEAVQKMAEAGGNSATAAKVVTNVTGVTNQRLSLNNGNHGGNKGGHGVGLLEEGSGAAIWAQYVHGKDSVEDMPSDAGASSYEGQYNGIVMGVDFKKVGKFQSGIAFNYGEGDTNSVNTSSPTRSDYDFWGIGYYGNIRNADSNVIFDIGYAKTDSDVTSSVNVGALKQTYEASPETTTWTAGVKVEKLYQNNNVQVVPYTGLRYMSIDPDDYSTKCGALSYNLERQDIWLLPVGVSIKQEIVNSNGWVVTPKVDLSYIWAFGDTDSSMETNTVFGTDNRPIGYDVMDDGSWMGLVGVEAAMDDWTFGVSYSYQKGDHSESKKWYVDAKYSF